MIGKADQRLPTSFPRLQMAYKDQSNLLKHKDFNFKIWLFWLCLWCVCVYVRTPHLAFPESLSLDEMIPASYFPNPLIILLLFSELFPISPYIVWDCGNQNHTPFSNGVCVLPNLGRLTSFFNQKSKPSPTGSSQSGISEQVWQPHPNKATPSKSIIIQCGKVVDLLSLKWDV